MVLIGPFLLKTMRTIEDKNIPSRREQNLHSGLINLYIATSDFNKEKTKNKKRRRTKRYPTETLTRSTLRESSVTTSRYLTDLQSNQVKRTPLDSINESII